jgi:hypothetical protein
MSVNLNDPRSADARGWGPGFPHCQTGKIVTLNVAGVTFPAGARKEIHELVTLLVEETENRGYRLHDGWCWGFDCRAITGTSTPSNHSWGLAFDINAPHNPLTDDGVTHTDMPSWMPNLWNSYGFRWGGDYSGSRRDSMHYEFMGTPNEARAITARARKELDVALTDKQKADIAWLDGFRGRFEGKPSPKDPGDRRAGWRNADKVAPPITPSSPGK